MFPDPLPPSSYSHRQDLFLVNNHLSLLTEVFTIGREFYSPQNVTVGRYICIMCFSLRQRGKNVFCKKFIFFFKSGHNIPFGIEKEEKQEDGDLENNDCFVSEPSYARNSWNLFLLFLKPLGARKKSNCEPTPNVLYAVVIKLSPIDCYPYRAIGDDFFLPVSHSRFY